MGAGKVDKHLCSILHNALAHSNCFRRCKIFRGLDEYNGDAWDYCKKRI